MRQYLYISRRSITRLQMRRMVRKYLYMYKSITKLQRWMGMRQYICICLGGPSQGYRGKGW